MILNVIKKDLPLTEYYKKETTKKQIILHHTVSGGTADPVINWWKQDKIHVAVAYIVEKNGDIVECFDPKYWSYHIGKGSTTEHNKQAIGIEIINEGWLTKNDNEYRWFENKNKYKGDKVFEYNWREQKYWAPYTIEQVNSVAKLCTYLCNAFNIPKQVLGTFDYNIDYFNYNGILAHCNLRSDKTDISPAFPYNKLENMLD